MLQFPRWRVEVTVDGDVVKTFQEVATTAKAAIGKAKHKMRGAISNVGPFKFKAVRADASTRSHATKASPKSQRDMYYDAERRSADINNTFMEMLPTMRRRDLEKLIEKRPALWGRFAGYLKSGHVFADDAPAGTRQHAVKKSPAQLDREINEILSGGPRTHHARVAPVIGNASAGFAIHTDHEDVTKDNARERFGTNYGDAKDRAKRMKEGLVDAEGEITRRGWDQLQKDIRTLENNALAWLRKTFSGVRDEGHDAYGDVIGGLSFDPLAVDQARNIYYGAREGRQERIDFNDSGHGDFAGSAGAWKGVSTFGQELLGGHITFFDVDKNALDIAEETADRADRRKRR